MEKLTLKQFFNWKILSYIGLYAIVHLIVEKFELWYYSRIPYVLDLESLLSLGYKFVDLIIIVSVAFYFIRWLNKVISWSSNKVFLRVIIEIIILTVFTNLILYISSQIQIYIKVGHIFVLRDILLLCSFGTMINFTVIPIIELSLTSFSKSQSESQANLLLLENERFRYELLENQLNPHFLFNSLSVLNSLISVNPDQAKKFTNTLSDVLRHVLDFKFSETISLQSEQDFIVQYVYLLNIRFGDALVVDLSFPEKHLNKKILPMVLQILIENVIKHNKVIDIQPMKISVVASDNGISISNPIQLKSSVSSWGIGLDNIKKRYDSFGYSIEVVKRQGTFCILIPYI